MGQTCETTPPARVRRKPKVRTLRTASEWRRYWAERQTEFQFKESTPRFPRTYRECLQNGRGIAEKCEFESCRYYLNAVDESCALAVSGRGAVPTREIARLMEMSTRAVERVFATALAKTMARTVGERVGENRLRSRVTKSKAEPVNQQLRREFAELCRDTQRDVEAIPFGHGPGRSLSREEIEALYPGGKRK